MYSSLYSLLWQCVLAYEAGRLMVCWDGSKMSKNMQPTTLAALPWPGGALSYVKHGLQGTFLAKQGKHTVVPTSVGTNPILCGK